MRSTFAGLNTMVRGINANQVSLDTVGHNITNAATTGYSRQSVNLVAAQSQSYPTVNGDARVGSGVESLSITRARNVYADKQYWAETATQNYYSTTQTNYDKVEAIFDDSDKTGIQNALSEFYSALQDLSTGASTASNRTAVVEKATNFVDKVQTAAEQMQSQIKSQYDDLSSAVTQVNSITDQIVELNKNIMTTEANGASANDLRDQRDLLVDKLSKYTSVNVYESSDGMYSVVSNGITLVGGVNRLTLEMSDPINNADYGINDYNIQIKESGINFLPTNGTMKALQDTIAEDKGYIDDLSAISGTFLTTFNNVHQQGAGIDGSDSKLGTSDGPSFGLNFFGDNDTVYQWDDAKQAVKATKLNNIQRTLEPKSGTDPKASVTVNITGGVASTQELKGINIIKELGVNLAIKNDHDKIAARIFKVTENTTSTGANAGTYSAALNGTGDGTNAVNIASVINMEQKNVSNTATVKLNGTAVNTVTGGADTTTERMIGTNSINAYYNAMMSQLGSDSESMDDKADAQDDLIEQITDWRSSTSGVDWNEELSNMIMFQQGYSACSRCLTTMDEMLDRLVNNTGEVGR